MAEKKEEKKGKKEAEEPKAEEKKEDAPAAEEGTDEEVSLEVEKEVVDVPSEKEAEKEIPKSTFDVAGWDPKTSIGKEVKAGTITNVDQILDNGKKILEAQIVDILLPDAESDLLLIGQSKGKFGGGQRRVFKQTQKKTREGNKPKFGTYAVVGNYNGYVGIGFGKSKETVPAREKAIRNAKLSLFKIRRGCGSWQCGCKGPHSIPFKVQGKCGSVIVTLMPAPKGKGLCVESECAKVLKFAGIKDVWSRTEGKTVSKINLMKACEKALKQLETVKINPEQVNSLGICDGKIAQEEKENE